MIVHIHIYTCVWLCVCWFWKEFKPKNQFCFDGSTTSQKTWVFDRQFQTIEFSEIPCHIRSREGKAPCLINLSTLTPPFRLFFQFARMQIMCCTCSWQIYWFKAHAFQLQPKEHAFLFVESFMIYRKAYGFTRYGFANGSALIPPVCHHVPSICFCNRHFTGTTPVQTHHQLSPATNRSSLLPNTSHNHTIASWNEHWNFVDIQFARVESPFKARPSCF